VFDSLQRGVAQALLPVVDLVAVAQAASELGLVLAIEGVCIALSGGIGFS
jgi:hypothetical protein